MQITSTRYPLIEILTRTDHDFPQIIEQLSQTPVLKYLQTKGAGLSQLFDMNYEKNSMESADSHRFYYLSEGTCQSLANGHFTKTKLVKRFLNHPPDSQLGSVLCENGSHYVYAYLGWFETYQQKHIKGIYLGVAVFDGTNIIDFEQAIIRNDHLETLPGHELPKENSFVNIELIISFLVRLGSGVKVRKLNRNTNTTGRPVYAIE